MTSVERVDPPCAANETTTLLAYLDYHRDTLRMKVEGLTSAQLDTALAPADMTLGGMMKHLAFVEHWWFPCVYLGQEFGEPWAAVDWDADDDWDWHSAANDDPGEIRTLFDKECATTDVILSANANLDQLSVRPNRRNGELFSLRWILVHMIEEYARHNGHADLIRESIDGRKGE